jgi:hypothetical protein
MAVDSTQTSTSFHWNTYGMMEYMLVLHPGDLVNEKIIQEKLAFKLQYGDKITVKTKQYITVANFFAKEVMEETLNRWINNICNQQPGFELQLNNYSGFPPHTIYIRIQDPMPVNNLGQKLKVIDNFIQSSDCPPLQVKSKPHVPISQRLPASW